MTPHDFILGVLTGAGIEQGVAEFPFDPAHLAANQVIGPLLLGLVGYFSGTALLEVIEIIGSRLRREAAP